MIHFSAIIFSLLLFVIIRFTILKKIKIKKYYRPRIIISITIIIISNIIIIHSGQIIERDLKTNNWTKTQGIVISVKITGSRASSPEIIYSYTIDEKQFEDTSFLNAPMFGGKRKKREVAEALIEKYSIGESIKVFYNPDDNSKSRITPMLKWNSLGQISFGVALLIISLCLLTIRKKPDSN